MTCKKREILKNFIIEHNVHKKELAECIGVTLSYVYNLIDETLGFPARELTLVRIATITDSSIGEFVTNSNPYSERKLKIKESYTVTHLKECMNMDYKSTVEFLRRFPIEERLEIVDILAGLKPIPIDYKKFKNIFRVAGIADEDIYNFWQEEFVKFLDENGFNSSANKEMLDAMLNATQKF